MSEAAMALNPEKADQECPLSARVREASIMLELFEGLGVRSLAVTITNEAGRKVAFYAVSITQAQSSQLPVLLADSFQRHLNVIV